MDFFVKRCKRCLTEGRGFRPGKILVDEFRHQEFPPNFYGPFLRKPTKFFRCKICLLQNPPDAKIFINGVPMLILFDKDICCPPSRSTSPGDDPLLYCVAGEYAADQAQRAGEVVRGRPGREAAHRGPGAQDAGQAEPRGAAGERAGGRECALGQHHPGAEGAHPAADRGRAPRLRLHLLHRPEPAGGRPLGWTYGIAWLN